MPAAPIRASQRQSGSWPLSPRTKVWQDAGQGGSRPVRPIQSGLCVAAAVLSLCGVSARAAAESPRPNIIVILADDLGYSDLGCFGGEIRTPHLDALAGRGLRFTQFYNGGRCCPTRASLLTGLYPHQAGVGHMMEDRGHDGYRGNLNHNCATIAEVMRAAGYRTAMSGKWHLSLTEEQPGQMKNLSN